MNGPGDVVAGLAPPQDTPSAVAYTAAVNGGSPQPTGDAKGLGDSKAADGLTEEKQEGEEAPFVGNALSGWIWQSWARNKRARDIIEWRLLACLRARRGVYYSGDLQTMWTYGSGEPIYLAYAATKMRQAEAALRDLLLPDGERPWGLDPTSIPELPPDVMEKSAQKAAAEARQQMMQAVQQGGNVINLEQFRALTLEIQEKLRDQILEAERKEAKERAGRMEEAIDERMERGGYYPAMAEFIQHFCTYPSAVFKGPFLQSKKTMRYDRQNKPVVTNKPQLTWKAVNPFDCYPAPEAETCQDGDFIERIRMSRADLFNLIGVPGYNEAAIRNALANHATGALRTWIWSDAERRALQGDTHDVWIADYLLDALHYWGSVQGQVLIDHGIINGVDDPLAYYEVDAVMIGNEVIRCELNDDPLGRRPYFNACFDPVPGAFWGNSIFELMSDCQAMINAAARALNANLGLSSGPVTCVDMSQLAAGQDPKMLRPLQIIQLDRSRAQAAADPITFFQAKSNFVELMTVIEKFEAIADDLTSIPRYLGGAQDATGAAETASGLSMLLGSAAKGLRRAVANIDRGVVSKTVEATFHHEMLYNPDETIKGDCVVVARGAAAVLIKEHLQQTRTQFLAQTNNPTDMQIIGIKGRRAVLKEVAATMDLPTEEIFGTDQEFMEEQQQRQAMPPQPTPDAKLKSQTDLRKEGIKSATQLAKEGIIHPAAAARAASAPPPAMGLTPPDQETPPSVPQAMAQAGA